MIQDTINEFRKENNKPPVSFWDRILSDHCLWHTFEMVKRGNIFHSEEFYRPGYGEIVACGLFEDNIENSLKRLIYNLQGEHKEALLNWSHIGYAYFIDKGRIYLTIRGK